MPEYPTTETWTHASARQANRAARSFVALKKRHVPVFWGPLFVDDDEEVDLQTAQDVARRTLVLWAVELRAEGAPQAESLNLIEQLDLWPYVSSNESSVLKNDHPSPDECQWLVWRLESIWVLLWALGYIKKLAWPSGMCDVPKLVRLISPHEADPGFIKQARLRPVAELLDAQDLTMRIHWAIRDAYLHQGGTIPHDLDWSGKGKVVPVELCAAVGVVEQRHYVLNWLVKYLNPADWDNVDTPT